MKKIFISYVRENKRIVQKFVERMKNDGFDIWIDYNQSSGKNFPKEINDALEKYDVFLMFWSKYAKESYWFEVEWTAAITLRKKIVTILLDDSEIIPLLQARLYIKHIDFDSSYKQILKSVRDDSADSIEGSLKILEKTGKGHLVKISTNSKFITIGRSPNCDVHFDDQRVSWEHGNILFTGNEYIYRHISATNPTRIKRDNEEILLKKDINTEYTLRNNDLITIGKNELIIQFSDPFLKDYPTTKNENSAGEINRQT